MTISKFRSRAQSQYSVLWFLKAPLKVLAAISDTTTSNDLLDNPDFNAVEYVNELFPTGTSSLLSAGVS